jgi:hypothetical protein
MKGIRNRREWKVALISASTAAVLGMGMAAGAHAFAGPNTTYLAATRAKQVVAVTKREVRESAASTKRLAAKRPAKALATFEGELSVDDGLFKLDVQRMVGKESSRYSWQLFEHRAALHLAPGVGIVDWRGMQVAPALADDAIVRVRGRLLPRSSWQWSDDGDLRPVINAQRIVVLRLDHELGD